MFQFRENDIVEVFCKRIHEPQRRKYLKNLYLYSYYLKKIHEEEPTPEDICRMIHRHLFYICSTYCNYGIQTVRFDQIYFNLLRYGHLIRIEKDLQRGYNAKFHISKEDRRYFDLLRKRHGQLYLNSNSEKKEEIRRSISQIKYLIGVRKGIDRNRFYETVNNTSKTIVINPVSKEYDAK